MAFKCFLLRVVCHDHSRCVTLFNAGQQQQRMSTTEVVAVMPFLRSHLLRYFERNVLCQFARVTKTVTAGF